MLMMSTYFMGNNARSEIGSKMTNVRKARVVSGQLVIHLYFTRTSDGLEPVMSTQLGLGVFHAGIWQWRAMWG
jgi:hypothetical protein